MYMIVLKKPKKYPVMFLLYNGNVYNNEYYDEIRFPRTFYVDKINFNLLFWLHQHGELHGVNIVSQIIKQK